MTKSKLKSTTKSSRRASAVVELAVCLPIIMLLVWGTIELNNSIFLKQTLTSAAHEGALVGTGNGATSAEIIQRVETVMNNRTELPFAVTIDTENGLTYDALESGSLFTVVVTSTPRSFTDAVETGDVDARISAIKP